MSTSSAMTFHARFDYAGCCITVAASEQADLDWLREFLSPDFSEIADVPSEPRVSFRRDANEYEDLRRNGPASSAQSVASFALDTTLEWLPQWTTGSSSELVVYDKRFSAFLRRKPHARQVELIAPPDAPDARTAFMRAVRELVTGDLVDRDCLLVHGAGFVWKSTGYVIAGPKEAGKTTLLLHVLSSIDAKLLANDRTTIRTGAPLLVRGMPTIVSVRPASVSRLPQIEARFRDCCQHHTYSLSENAALAQTADTLDRNGAWSLSPSQLAGLLGVKRSAEVPLNGILFPLRTGAPGSLSVKRLAPDEAAPRLEQALFRAGSPIIVGDFFRASDRVRSLEHAATLCHETAARVPCVECVLGLDAYADPGAVGRILEALTGP